MQFKVSFLEYWTRVSLVEADSIEEAVEKAIKVNDSNIVNEDVITYDPEYLEDADDHPNYIESYAI